ncbi:hypothetical protein GCM10011297_11830 [Bacterioplanes sanyensis]|uniref:TorF family putative porin n=1 Tax=Bacterioplanes sanyensis TaxID=1249553 RepID=UPI001674665F|nr:TorF family putative porin [Bacterioplanes sanyensis]GGY40562.1 hypothetical protein GCM10011297_11830 [Bacterioplanes sanyensis]
MLRAVLSASAALAVMLSPAAQADFQAHIGATSEYIRDGISYTRAEPTLQTGLSYQHTSGLYAGVWGSGVRLQKDSPDYETDAYLGWYVPLSDRLAIDTSLTHYRFIGDKDVEIDAYNELTVRALYDDALMFGWRKAPEYLGSEHSKSAFELAYTVQTGTFSIEMLTARHQYHSYDDDFNFGDERRDDYWQFRIGVGRSYGAYDYQLSLERTNLGSEFDAGTNFLFTVQRYFNF